MSRLFGIVLTRFVRLTQQVKFLPKLHFSTCLCRRQSGSLGEEPDSGFQFLFVFFSQMVFVVTKHRKYLLH